MDDLTDPATSAIVALATMIATYYGKLKKNFDKVEKTTKVVFGDLTEDKPGLVNSMKDLKEEVRGLTRVHDRMIETLEDLAKALPEQQKNFEVAMKEALRPLWKAVDKKVDKELMNTQMSHILADIERLMR